MKQLHAQGFSMLSIDAQGQTALHYAARYGHKDIIQFLIACAPQALINMADNDKSVTFCSNSFVILSRNTSNLIIKSWKAVDRKKFRGDGMGLLSLMG